MDHVWYAAYGSNMSRARLMRYLNGDDGDDGRPAHVGCRDPSLHRRDVEHEVVGAVGFGGSSVRWSGGTAQLRLGLPTANPVRLWEVTVEQVADVQAQECALAPGDLTLDPEHLLGAGTLDVVAQRRYGRQVWLGTHDGLPIVSFTASMPVPVAAPTDAYLAAVGRGLVEMGWAPERAAAHLAHLDGVRGHRTPPEVAALLI